LQPSGNGLPAPPESRYLRPCGTTYRQEDEEGDQRPRRKIQKITKYDPGIGMLRRLSCVQPRRRLRRRCAGIPASQIDSPPETKTLQPEASRPIYQGVNRARTLLWRSRDAPRAARPWHLRGGRGAGTTQGTRPEDEGPDSRVPPSSRSTVLPRSVRMEAFLWLAPSGISPAKRHARCEVVRGGRGGGGLSREREQNCT
jgi:hypothetical protein